MAVTLPRAKLQRNVVEDRSGGVVAEDDVIDLDEQVGVGSTGAAAVA